MARQHLFKLILWELIHLLEALLESIGWGLTAEAQQNFRFHHISTDEVYGDLEGTTRFISKNNSIRTELSIFCL